MRYVRRLEECSFGAVGGFGGKIAALGELLRAGFNVPPGFAIAAEAYRKQMRRLGLWEELRRIFDREGSEIGGEARALREAIEGASMPKDVEEELREAFREFANALRSNGEEPVFAVRSSATLEDLPDLSFAGQFESFLGIRGEEEFLSAVRRCWGSALSPRALAYLRCRGLPAEGLAMSIAVQKMVRARSSGVMFTLDPSSGDRSKIVINANWGLGESVVGGSAEVDHFVISKLDFEILRSEVRRKRIFVPPDEDLGERELPEELRERPSLAEEEVRELARQARSIERLFGRPQDVEFAIDGEGGIFILQSRPETRWHTNSLLPSSGDLAEQITKWFLRKR